MDSRISVLGTLDPSQLLEEENLSGFARVSCPPASRPILIHTPTKKACHRRWLPRRNQASGGRWGWGAARARQATTANIAFLCSPPLSPSTHTHAHSQTHIHMRTCSGFAVRQGSSEIIQPAPLTLQLRDLGIGKEE